MAAHNIVALIESKFDSQKAQVEALKAQFDSQNALFRAQFDALHRENATTRRWLAVGLSGLGIMIAVLRLLD